MLITGRVSGRADVAAPCGARPSVGRPSDAIQADLNGRPDQAAVCKLARANTEIGSGDAEPLANRLILDLVECRELTRRKRKAVFRLLAFGSRCRGVRYAGDAVDAAEYAVAVSGHAEPHK